MAESGSAKGPNQKLDSWKEIASFFQRDERTVKRWEKERGLPVHRLQGSPTGRVYAFTDELAAWMKAPPSSKPITENEEFREADPPAVTAGVPRRRKTDSAEVEAVLAGLADRQPVYDPFSIPAPVPPPTMNSTSRRRGGLYGSLVIVSLLIIVGVGAYRRRVSNRPSALTGSPTADGTHETDVPLTKSSARTPDPEAREFYLKGRYEWNKRTPESLNKAVDYFTQAIVHDPKYAEAYVGLADCYNLLREYSIMPSAEAYPRALAAARKAVALDDSSAEAHLSLAFATFYGQLDVPGAEREFRRALALNPNYARAHHWYATFLMALGRYQQALEEINRAQQLDPGSTPILADKGLILLFTGEKDQGVALLRQLELTEPPSVSAFRYMETACLMSNDYPGYLAAREQAAHLSRDQRELAIVKAGKSGLASGGQKGMWTAILKKQEQLYDEGRIPAFDLAMTCARLGMKPEALHYLAAADQNHEPALVGIRDASIFGSLAEEPAYKDLVARLGLH